MKVRPIRTRVRVLLALTMAAGQGCGGQVDKGVRPDKPDEADIIEATEDENKDNATGDGSTAPTDDATINSDEIQVPGGDIEDQPRTRGIDPDRPIMTKGIQPDIPEPVIIEEPVDIPDRIETEGIRPDEP